MVEIAISQQWWLTAGRLSAKQNRISAAPTFHPPLGILRGKEPTLMDALPPETRFLAACQVG
jgi:hypothetical protein